MSERRREGVAVARSSPAGGGFLGGPPPSIPATHWWEEVFLRQSPVPGLRSWAPNPVGSRRFPSIVMERLIATPLLAVTAISSNSARLTCSPGASG